MSPALTPDSNAGVSFMISVISAVEPSTGFSERSDVDSDPAMARFTETDEVVPDFFRGIDRQSVTGGAVLDLGDEDANDFAFEIQKRRARFAALGGDIHPNVGCIEMTAHKFPIEPGHHPKARRFREIEWVTDRHHRRRHFQGLRLADWRAGRGDVRFQNGNSASESAIKTLAG